MPDRFYLRAPSTGLRGWDYDPLRSQIDEIYGDVFRYQDLVLERWAVAETFPDDHPGLEDAISAALVAEKGFERAKWRLEQIRVKHPHLSMGLET